MKRDQSSLFVLLILLLLPIAESVATTVSVDSWIDKMNQAIHRQNYQGTLVIRQNDTLQALKVKQGVSPQGVEPVRSWQTLESLTGEPQTIIRQNNQITSIFPSRKLLTITRHTAGESTKVPLHPVLPDDLQNIKRYYILKLGGEERVANKTTQIVKMIPRDHYRYGYTFWLDKQSGLLLKCDLLDQSGKVLEQLMYSDIEFLASEPRKKFDEASLVDYKKINLITNTQTATMKWQVKNMPAGFSILRSVKTHKQTYHLVLSDGMASVSVFIEPRKKSYKPVIGASSMGLINVYSAYMNDTYVTAIGEVPVSTVQMIAQSMQLDH